VAAANLADPQTDVYMVGRVGDDDFGQRLLNGLTQHRVRTEFVTVTEGHFQRMRDRARGSKRRELDPSSPPPQTPC